jgi:hypothetical protein
MGTNFPNGLFSQGVPVLGGQGFLSGGKAFFVDPVNGSDGNNGKSWNRAFATLSHAHSLCTAGKNDVVYLIGDGQATGTARESATLAWSKDTTHLIGITAAPTVASRARISSTSGATAFSPLITVSADGCLFANLHAFHGFNDASAQVCLNVTGERNVFQNCHWAGMGHATAGDDAGGSSVALAGGSENTFINNVIGLDTVARSTTNAEIDLSSAATRNRFLNCEIITFADNAGHLFVKADSSGDIDRFCIFRNCIFTNAIGSTATTMTAAINPHASVGGLFLLYDCMLVGATDWTAADSTNVYLYGAGMNPSGNLNTGIAHTTDVS